MRSGNMVVRVGRELDSGSFYEGSGTATITVAGSVKSDWTALVGTATTANPAVNSTVASTAVSVPASTVLAVDTGQLDLTAGGSIQIGSIVNPVETHIYKAGSPIAATLNSTNQDYALPMDTYGPQSAVSLTAFGGDVVIRSDLGLLSNLQAVSSVKLFAEAAQTYPTIVDVSGLRGNIVTPQSGMVLTDSPSATLDLIAEDSIDLRGGVAPSATTTIVYGQTAAGTALIDLAFNPYEPNEGTANRITLTLAHANDPADDLYDHIYAVTGDILGGGVISIPRPVLVQAGRDIIDLNLIAQNIRTSDVSQVIAGRDISYDGLLIGGGVEIAGPGFLDVEAGRNLGPFLPAFADKITTVTKQQGIVSTGNTDPFAVGNQLYSLRIGRPTNSVLLGPKVSGSFIGLQNPLLPATGASIVALFGVAQGIDYQAVVTNYIDPATASIDPDLPSADRHYLADLAAFLNAHGYKASSGADAWAQWGQLNPLLQHMFIDQVFFNELSLAGSTQPVAGDKSPIMIGYEMVNTMFPASLGYTADSQGMGSAFGAAKVVKTGDLNLLHATIQTDDGGDIRLFGPGGQILVGSLEVEPNTNLKLYNVGLLTLNGGGVYTYTDDSVLVNSSRVFTEDGGDILMWSSNGDLDAGRGAQTTASQPALAVSLNPDGYQTVLATGLVTGAGIATLPTKNGAPPADVILLAPKGKIIITDAPIRSTRNVVLFAQEVLGAYNITAAGTITNNTAPAVPSLPSLLAPQTTTLSPRSVDPDANRSAPADRPSLVIVEVLRYGGGDAAPAADQNKDAALPANQNGGSDAGGKPKPDSDVNEKEKQKQKP